MLAEIVITVDVGDDEIIGIKDFLSDKIEEKYTVKMIDVVTGEQGVLDI